MGWVGRHKVAVFYVLAVVFSWTWWIGMILRGEVVGPGHAASHLPGLMGPAVAALVTAVLSDGGAGLAALLRRTVRVPRSPLVWLVIFSPLMILAGWMGVLRLMGEGLPPMADFLTYPGIPEGATTLALLIAVVLLNGFGEEMGWRGFALDALLEHMSPFRATLIVAAMWLLWHAPLFWFVEGMQGLIGPMLIGWIVGLVLGAFLLTGLYLWAGRSVLAVALWHVSYNLSVATDATRGLPAALVTSLVMVLGAWSAWRLWRIHVQHA